MQCPGSADGLHLTLEQPSPRACVLQCLGAAQQRRISRLRAVADVSKQLRSDTCPLAQRTPRAAQAAETHAVALRRPEIAAMRHLRRSLARPRAVPAAARAPPPAPRPAPRSPELRLRAAPWQRPATSARVLERARLSGRRGGAHRREASNVRTRSTSFFSASYVMRADSALCRASVMRSTCSVYSPMHSACAAARRVTTRPRDHPFSATHAAPLSPPPL